MDNEKFEYLYLEVPMPTEIPVQKTEENHDRGVLVIDIFGNDSEDE